MRFKEYILNIDIKCRGGNTIKAGTEVSPMKYIEGTDLGVYMIMTGQFQRMKIVVSRRKVGVVCVNKAI